MIKRRSELFSLLCIRLHALVMSRTLSTVNPHSIIAWISRNPLREVYVTETGLERRITWLVNEHSVIWQNWPNDWALFRVLTWTMHLTVYSSHVTYSFRDESAGCSCLNVKEPLARSTREIWNLSDCNWTQTQNHLPPKGTLNDLVKLAKWLTCSLSTYL